jgi:hypothetical protein
MNNYSGTTINVNDPGYDRTTYSTSDVGNVGFYDNLKLLEPLDNPINTIIGKLLRK